MEYLLGPHHCWHMHDVWNCNIRTLYVLRMTTVGLNITPRVAKVNTRAFCCLRASWICFDVVCSEIQEIR